MEELKFTHLHVHTQYSLLDGASKITDLVEKAKSYGMDSLAITDHGVMYGVIEFYKECLNKGIKPIIGVELYVINGDILDKTKGREERRYHLILLAENNEGYSNLIKLVSETHTKGYYYKPRASKELLRKYSKGLIALSACINGEVAVNILENGYEKAVEVAKEYQGIFGKDNFFLEMQCNELNDQLVVNDTLKKMSKELGIDLVITNDVHYTNYEDYDTQDILMCIQTGKKVNDTDRMKMPTNDFYLKETEEIYDMFKDVPEAINNTHKIAERCNVTFEFGVLRLPKFKIDKEISSFDYLKELCEDGLKKIYTEVTQELKDRLKFELDIINKMGYVDYFLIVWDFIKYAKSNDIPVGPGRGSAAGSLVSYVLNITEVDPIKYNLLFERFLNPERVSMPDIDIDFCYVRRQEVIDYVIKKYGEDSVAQIVTFGTMAAKNAIRDVGRVLDMPYADVDAVAKMIPFEMKMTIAKAMEVNKELKELYLTNERVKYLIDTSMKLEGLPRHASTHAAGVVITEKPVSDYVPLAKSEDFVVTQFNMTIIEELGLLKMDFLGLRTLTVIKDAVDSIKLNYNKELDMLKIDYEDSNVYKMISKGLTRGIFQLESKGITRFMKELEPNCLNDIIAGISLYRPGPMDFIPQYIAGKKNPLDVSYVTPELEPILSQTYGTIVYQEQVMEIFRNLAGYSLGRSDLVRRAMSKKKMDVMLKEKEIFINGSLEDNVDGCVKRGIKKENAEKIYNQMIDFAKYAFNKSHSACYAYVAYQTAYLRYYYPAEFFAATISSFMENQGKVSEYINEAQSLGISIWAPDINESTEKFVAKDNYIRYSLSAVSGIGRDIIESLVKERNENGKFISITNFIERMLEYNISKKAIENLIKVGAFDSLGGYRSQYLAVYINIYDTLQSIRRREMTGQIDLFSLDDENESEKINDNLPNLEEINEKVKLIMEKELLGVYVSGHPLKQYENLISKYSTHTTFELNEKDEDTNEYLIKDETNVKILGTINKMNLKITKNNQMMAFVDFEDIKGNVELVVFPKVYEKCRDYLVEDNIVYVIGRTNYREDEGCKILVSNITGLEELILMNKEEKVLHVEIESIKDKKLLQELEEIFKLYPGDTKIEILVKEDKKIRTPKLRVSIDDKLIQKLNELLKSENVNVIE